MRADLIYLHPSTDLYRNFLDARLGTVGLSWNVVKPFWPAALAKTQDRFNTIRNKYYLANSQGLPLRAGHIGHTTLFLYELSRQAWLAGDQYVADVLYFLNVSGGGCNLLYEIDVPLGLFATIRPGR